LILQIVFFGPVMPSKCTSSSCEPSNHPFQACSATMLFEYGRLNPRNASLGCYSLHSVRVWADAFSNLSFGLSTLLFQHARILVAIYQFGCRMSNTKVSPRFATPNGPYSYQTCSARNFLYLWYKVCTDGRIGCLTMNWAST
jgi:hypothetical protein